MTATSLANQRFTTGVDSDATVFPRRCIARPPIVYCNSASMTGGEALGIGQLPAVGPLTKSLVAATQMRLGAPTLDQLWGNATSQGRINDTITWMRSSGVTTPAPVVLIGASMGACAALSWAAANPFRTACVIGIIPAVDLQSIRVADVTLRNSIDAAYGVSYPAALPAGTNPVSLASVLASVPIQLWTASNDAVSDNADDFALAHGGTDFHNLGAIGHTSAAVAAVNIDQVVDFILEHT